MATLSGTSGNVTFANNYTAHVHSWSADIVTEALEVTAWQLGTGTPNPDLPWRSYIPGLSGWSGSFDCYLDGNELPEPGKVVGGSTVFWLQLNIDDYHYYEGYAICTAVRPSAPIEGVQSVTIEFQGSLSLGAVTTTAAPGGPAPTTTTGLL